MQSQAATVSQYLASLPADRRAAITALRKVILDNLDKTYAERMAYGMIGYVVPREVYPAGYHCNPKQELPFLMLASQKNYMSLYLFGLYMGGDGTCETPDSSAFRDAWTATGKKLDMGKCCVRFKKIEDVPLDVVGAAIRKIPAKKFIEVYTTALERMKTRPKGKPATAKTSAKSAAPAKKATKKVAAKSPTKAARTPAKKSVRT